MNKTININLGGNFFHIDEIAYKKLKRYLDAIRRSLSDDPKGKDEILTDIESRIGEILSERIKDIRQVVNEQDVEDIILVMGKPEDYVGDEDIFNDNPEASYQRENSKKLYRDSSDKFLGGVASGLGHYFNIDVIWVRIFWIVLVSAGVGILLYIILWILLPEANTTAEKLEMEGEAVTIDNIERKIKEQFTDVSQRLKDGFDEASQHFKKKGYQNKVKDGTQEVVSVFGRIFSVFFAVVGKFIGIIILFVSAVVLIASLISIFSVGSVEILGFNDDFIHYPPFFYSSRIPFWLLSTFLVVAISIPFIALLMLGLRILSPNVKSFGRTAKLSLLGIWLIAVFGMVFSVIEFGSSFAKENKVITKHDIIIKENDTLRISMIKKDYEDFERVYGLRTITDNNIEQIYDTDVRLDIRESKTGKSYLKIYKYANGISKLKAKEFADEVDYHFDTIQNNLDLNGYFLTDLNNKFRYQRVKVVLFLAEKRTIYLDKSTKYYLRYVDNIQDIYDRKMPEHYFKMTKKGLDCLDCDDIDNSYKDKKDFKLKINSDGIDIRVNEKDVERITIDEDGVKVE
jgi:phage shock protein PspC (stress-responsive transcriptional regulator)